MSKPLKKPQSKKLLEDESEIPALKWEQVQKPISFLKDYETNPRKITKKDFDKLVKSIKDDGYHQRILINTDGTIIGGHQRKKALLKAGFKNTDLLDVLIPDRELTKDEFNRINIRDNLSFGEYDFDILANNFEIDQLIEWGMPEDWLNFSVDEIEVSEEDDEIPDAPSETITKLGDVWELGEHRLVCGNSTDINDVERLMDGEVVDMVYTDPPYGISLKIGDGNGNGLAKKNSYRNIDGDNSIEIAKDVFALIIALKIPNIVYWGANYYDFLPPSRCWISWYKKEELPSDDFCDTELAYTNIDKHTKTFSVNWKGMIKEGEMGEKRSHPAQKPVKLAIDIFKYFKVGNVILDLFGGSGSTLIACEKSKRKCLMMELSPTYCDIIIARWEKLTNKKARLLNGC